MAMNNTVVGSINIWDAVINARDFIDELKVS